jgi:hypothetical protein
MRVGGVKELEYPQVLVPGLARAPHPSHHHHPHPPTPTPTHARTRTLEEVGLGVQRARALRLELPPLDVGRAAALKQPLAALQERVHLQGVKKSGL